MSYPNGPQDGPGDQPASGAQPSPWGQYTAQTGQQPAGAPGQQPGAQQWGQPTGGQPTQQYGQPGQQYGQPTGGQPTQHYGQPGQQWGQPTGGQPTQQYGQPTQQYGQPTQQWGQPSGAQPAAGYGPQTGSHQPWGGAPAGPQPGQSWPAQPGYPGGPGGYGPPPAKKTNKGVIITAVAVVVALLTGFGIWWFAIRDTQPEGKETPQQAAAQLFADIDNGDMIALADTFDPVEAQFVNDLAGDVVEHMKRLGLLTSDATVGNSTGSTISIRDITFDDSAAEKPLTDLTIVKLTGGTITITPTDTTDHETDLFTQLKNAASKYSEDAGLPGQAAIEPTVIDIAEVVRDDNNGEPLRISTVLRDGSWYPSLFYTMADYWMQSENLGPVTAADMIAGVGADSPELAVEGMIDALSQQDAAAAIKLLPPDEMAAVHAYGGKIVQEAGPPSGDDTIQDFSAEWVTSEVTGGTLVSVQAIEFTADGEHGRIEIDKDAGTATVTANGETRVIDASTIADELGTGDLSEIHPNMPDFVARMLKAAMGLGVVTTEVNDKWYVSPPRTAAGVITTLLGGMETQDIQMFIDLADE